MIRWSPLYGRYLVAGRDIAAGEVILQEQPLLIVPKAGSEPTCLACMKPLKHDWFGCNKCSGPMCSPHCDGNCHGTEECNLLRRLSLKEAPQVEILIKELSIILGPLRALLLIERSPAVKNIFLAFQSHKDERKKMQIGRFVEHIAAVMHTHLGLDLKSEAIHHLCGVLDTNAFEVTLDNIRRGRAIFVAASMMNHSCIPNAQRWYSDGKMTVRAAIDIPKGAPVLINYTQALWGTRARNAHLSGCKMFTCQCKRCSDPTELGTHMSSVPCRECSSNTMPPSDPRSPWKCQVCGTSTSASAIEAMVRAAAVALSRMSRDDAEAITSTLSHLSRMLGNTHYVVAQVKYVFVQTIMKLPLKGVSSADLTRVLEVTTELMKLTAWVEPGVTRFRGLLLYDQTRVLVELLERNMAGEEEASHLTAASHPHTAQALLSQAAECAHLLQYDPLLLDVMQLIQELRRLLHTPEHRAASPTNSQHNLTEE
ncbi:SET domain-containing protein SmydA-8-like [Homarus americanus]|nr:SET domain-containing protein SmydA-8-like [Homarus americanus]